MEVYEFSVPMALVTNTVGIPTDITNIWLALTNA